MVAQGTAPKIPQTEIGATYDKMIKKDVVQVSVNTLAQITCYVIILWGEDQIQ